MLRMPGEATAGGAGVALHDPAYLPCAQAQRSPKLGRIGTDVAGAAERPAGAQLQPMVG